MTKMIRVAQFIAPIVGFLIAWQIFSTSGAINRDLFPPPTDVARAFIELGKSGDLFWDALRSVLRAVGGFVLGAFLGILVGILTGRIEIMNRILTPLVQVFRPIPSIAFVPLAIVWFGLGEESKIFLVMWGVFFPVWINAFLGVTQVPGSYLWAAQSLGAPNRKIMLEVVIPAAVPLIIAGMRVGVALAFLNVVAAEMAGAYVGLGYRITASHMVFRVDQMIVAIVALGMLGASADRIFAYLIKTFLPWYQTGR